MTSAQREIIAALADELVCIADEMRRSRLTQYAERIDRKARIISRMSSPPTDQKETPCKPRFSSNSIPLSVPCELLQSPNESVF